MEQTLALRPAISHSFTSTRAFSEQIAEELELEDLVVQTCFEVSPIKWHLGHTAWLFEHFILKACLPGYKPYDPVMEEVFNSYYTSVSKPFSKMARGMLSRPTVGQVLGYRRNVDALIQELLEGSASNPGQWQSLIELGIQHEKQHQELMLYDIKHILFSNPGQPAYRRNPACQAADSPAEVLDWVEFEEGQRTIGHVGPEFCYDNELPAHPEWVPSFQLASRAVTNQEYKAFVDDGGYDNPRWWLSDGWARKNAEGWAHPLYWQKEGAGWQEFTLYGWQPLADAVPVSHISFFEADAFARWAGHRLPTEAEWEVAAQGHRVRDGQCNKGILHPAPQYARLRAGKQGGFAELFGDVWEYTQSAYLPYPGYRFINDGLGEYNGKFMSGQMILRGGSCLTPEHHTRATYRNFFEPGSRWQCAGMRLARDGR